MSHRAGVSTALLAALLVVAATTAAPGAAITPGAARLPGAAATATVAVPGERTLVLELASVGLGLPSRTVPAAGTLTAPTRAAVARSLLPSASERSAAVTAAVAAGLTVLSGDASEVTVAGAGPTVDALVGGDRSSPVIPAGWRSTVAGIIDASTGVGMWHGDAAGGADPQSYAALSQAYGAGVPATVPPALTATTPVVASIQLSGWDPAVLTSAARGVFSDPAYDPVASGQYTPVDAGRAPAYVSQDDDGDDEVALDQETLLAAAPQLRQRAYFAVNSASGYATGLQTVYDDVAAGLPIVALSTSWGTCESLDSRASLAAIDAILAKLTAAGVTVFAASGDGGTLDCDGRAGPMTGVDFPASDPNVVGVGATTHPNGAAVPAPDTAWSQAQTADATEGGSGGGASAIFARPSYQDAVSTAAGRAVPDLAVDGDPATGVPTVIDLVSGAAAQTTVTSGGTSLSSPLAAALVADIAAARSSRTATPVGFGDIHATLYGHPEAFTDVVATTQSYGEGTGPTATPTPGYDTASGLGTPRLDVLAALLDTTTPAPVMVAAAVLNVAPVVTITSWSRPKPASAIGVVTWSVSGGTVPPSGFTVVAGSAAPRLLGAASRSTSFTLPAGSAGVTVTMNSSAGSSMATRTLTVPTDDRRIAHGWARVADRGAFLATLSVTGVRGRRASLTATGTTFRVTVRAGRSGGLAMLLLDGREVGTIDTYAARTQENVTHLFRSKRRQRHTVTVVVLGRGDAHARGTSVALDAVSIA